MPDPVPTKEQFEAYERVRAEGKYNMIMDARKARLDAGLEHEIYYACIHQYTALKEKYLVK